MKGHLFRLFLFGGLLLAGIFPLVTVGQSTDIKNLLYEELMLSAPTLESAQQHLQFLTTMPRVAGSQFDFQTAQYVRNKFLSWGIPAEMTPIPARLSFSRHREVRIVYPFAWTAPLKEAVIPEDPSSNATNIIPSYNAYSPSASVTGGVIYVNYGRLEDYQYLISHNISVEGAIVIARYGVISRNSKVLLAQLQGALGILLFSDPADSGWVKGPVFPQGPWGPSSRVERGSVLFTPVCPGNPSPARLALDGPCLNDNSPTDTTFPSIPSQPLSWEDAYPIISHLRGPIAPINWQGGMNVTYHFGVLNDTDEVQVALTTISNLTSSTIWNVVGTIKGAAEPENMIILGGHRDSWGFGASDPATGTSVLLEVARSFSYLMNTTAWRPRRTIKLCSWDGEEFAFIGSTAYAEDNFDSLYSHAIAYLNVDIGVSGTSLQPAATPSFATFIKNATQRISLPDDGGTLYNNWDLNVRTLGSGSDYVPFLDHVGVASLDITFKSSAYDGVYHSVYDSYYWMEHFGSMPYLKTCAQLFGLLALRLSNDLLLPFNYSDYSARLTTYTRGIEALIKDNDGEEEMTVNILLEAIQEFDQTASLLQLERIKLESLIKKANGVIAAPLAQSINHYNQRVAFAERNFTTPGGLENQGRPWYRHLIQAPGIYDGYAPDPFPGLAQAVRDQSWSQAIGEMARIAERIRIASTFLRDAPPVVDEYAGPIMAIRIASIVWGCLCFLVLLGLISFFTWRYLKNRRLMLLDSGQSSGDQFEYEFLEKEGFVSGRRNKHASMFS